MNVHVAYPDIRTYVHTYMCAIVAPCCLPPSLPPSLPPLQTWMSAPPSSTPAPTYATTSWARTPVPVAKGSVCWRTATLAMVGCHGNYLHIGLVIMYCMYAYACILYLYISCSCRHWRMHVGWTFVCALLRQHNRQLSLFVSQWIWD